MSEMIKIYLGKERKIVEAELIQDRKKSVLVRLADGNVIVRKKSRQVVNDDNA